MVPVSLLPSFSSFLSSSSSVILFFLLSLSSFYSPLPFYTPYFCLRRMMYRSSRTNATFEEGRSNGVRRGELLISIGETHEILPIVEFQWIGRHLPLCDGSNRYGRREIRIGSMVRIMNCGLPVYYREMGGYRGAVLWLFSVFFSFFLFLRFHHPIFIETILRSRSFSIIFFIISFQYIEFDLIFPFSLLRVFRSIFRIRSKNNVM